MRISVNGDSGIRLGQFGRVQRKTLTLNSFDGVSCVSCLVEGNTISNNGSYGVLISTGTVLGNMITGNASYGVARSEPDGGLVGFGNNTIIGNNHGGTQIFGVTPIQPNACSPAC